VPFIAKSDKAGEVVCDPVGTFPEEDAERLLEISGEDGLFKRVNEKMPEPTVELKTGEIATTPVKRGPGRPRLN